MTVYRSPKLSVPSFLTEFLDLLSVIHMSYDTCNLIGDFNIHADNLADTRAKDFLELLECMAFKQHVNVPTHKHGHTLDLIISYGLNINILSVTDLALSDHHCVFFNSFDHSLPSTTERIVKKRYITPEVTKTLTSYIATYKNNVLLSSCEDLVNDFNHKIKTGLDAVAPIKTRKITTKKVAPWKKNQTMELKRDCRIAEYRWRKTKVVIHHNILTEKLKNESNLNITASIFLRPENTNILNPRLFFSTKDSLVNPTTNYSIKLPGSKCEVCWLLQGENN